MSTQVRFLLLTQLVAWTTVLLFAAGGVTQQRYSIRIEPVEFFSKDLKRLEAHLDFWDAICFKVTVRGPVDCVPEVELWCDGERVDIRKYGVVVNRKSDEVSFALRRVGQTPEGRAVYRATAGGIYTFRRTLEEPKPRRPAGAAFGPGRISEPLEFGPPCESVIVWAMGAGEGIDLKKQSEVEKKLKEQPWAMFLRFYVRRESP